MVLILGMEMRAVMLHTWLGVHADDDTEETADLGHAFFLEFQQNDSILLQSTYRSHPAVQRFALLAGRGGGAHSEVDHQAHR